MSTIINVIVIVEHVLSVIQEKRTQIASAICARNNEMKKHQSSGLSGSFGAFLNYSALAHFLLFVLLTKTAIPSVSTSNHPLFTATPVK